MATKAKYIKTKTTDEVLSNYPNLKQDVIKIPLVGMFEGQEVKTNLFGVYSPSVKSILIDCKDRVKLTSNFDFVTEMEELSKRMKYPVLDMRSLSHGGKIYCSMNATSSIEIPTNISDVSFQINLYVIETNDTSFKLRVGAEVIMNGKSSFLLNDVSTESQKRNSTSFTSRAEDLPDLFKNALTQAQDFINMLSVLRTKPTTIAKNDEFFKDYFTDNSKTLSGKAMMILDTLHENVRVISNELNDTSWFSLVFGVGEMLYSKVIQNEIDYEFDLAVYLFGFGKDKNDQIINGLQKRIKKM